MSTLDLFQEAPEKPSRTAQEAFSGTEPTSAYPSPEIAPQTPFAPVEGKPCEACERARSRPHSGLYIADCLGCIARAIALSPQAFEARKLGDFTPAYRALLHAAAPKDVDWQQLHTMVKDWQA